MYIERRASFHLLCNLEAGQGLSELLLEEPPPCLSISSHAITVNLILSMSFSHSHPGKPVAARLWSPKLQAHQYYKYLHVYFVG